MLFLYNTREIYFIMILREGVTFYSWKYRKKEGRKE